MENASKALIMAGEIVIAVLVIGLFVYINRIFASFSTTMNDKISEAQISEFNNNFYKYSARYNITATEIATTINFAKETNDANNLSRTNASNSLYYVNIKINGYSFFNNTRYINNDNDYNDNIKFKEKVNQFINDNNEYLFSCDCKVDINTNLKKITITPNDNDILIEASTARVNKINFNLMSIDKYNIKNSMDYTK